MWGPGYLFDTGLCNTRSDLKRCETRVGEALYKPLLDPPQTPGTDSETQDKPLFPNSRHPKGAGADLRASHQDDSSGTDAGTKDKPLFPDKHLGRDSAEKPTPCLCQVRRRRQKHIAKRRTSLCFENRRNAHASARLKYSSTSSVLTLSC